jgi:hypothetical protein
MFPWLWSSKPWIQIRIDLTCWIRIRIEPVRIRNTDANIVQDLYVDPNIMVQSPQQCSKTPVLA